MERHNKPGLKNSSTTPSTLNMSPKDRVRFLANLIIDRIIEDQKSGSLLLKKASKQ